MKILDLFPFLIIIESPFVFDVLQATTDGISWLERRMNAAAESG
ncbi:MAG TPA: hypothetical protein VH601_12675 [Bryobacteraceae bacterium]